MCNGASIHLDSHFVYLECSFDGFSSFLIDLYRFLLISVCSSSGADSASFGAILTLSPITESIRHTFSHSSVRELNYFSNQKWFFIAWKTLNRYPFSHPPPLLPLLGHCLPLLTWNGMSVNLLHIWVHSGVGRVLQTCACVCVVDSFLWSHFLNHLNVFNTLTSFFFFCSVAPISAQFVTGSFRWTNFCSNLNFSSPAFSSTPAKSILDRKRGCESCTIINCDWFSLKSKFSYWTARSWNILCSQRNPTAILCWIVVFACNSWWKLINWLI